MVRRARWSVPVLAAAAFSIPLFAQQRPGTMTLFESGQAKDIAKQLEEGGFTLAQAIQIAEREGSGKALQAVAKIGSGMTGQPGSGAGTGGDAQQERPGQERPGQDRPGQQPNQRPGQTAGQNLMFEVVVFANNQLVTYHVDPKTREAKQHGTRVDLTRDTPRP